MVYTGTRGTFATGRWNEDVNFQGRLTRIRVFAVVGSDDLVDRVKLNLVHSRP